MSETSTSEPIRTVLVDDCADVNYLVATALELEGSFCVVGAAESARAGLGLVASTRPELVVTDLHLGNRDGLWLLPRLRAVVDRSTVLALVTGLDLTPSMRAMIADAGADVALPKQELATSLPVVLRQQVWDRRRLLARAG